MSSRLASFIGLAAEPFFCKQNGCRAEQVRRADDRSTAEEGHRIRSAASARGSDLVFSSNCGLPSNETSAIPHLCIIRIALVEV